MTTFMQRTRGAVNMTLLIICCALASGCQEDIHSKYATPSERERADKGARTWFPQILPSSASNLEVWYNIDTNDTVGRLRFDPSELERLRDRLSTQRICLPTDIVSDRSGASQDLRENRHGRRASVACRF